MSIETNLTPALRLYSLVAGNYLSSGQRGLQTGHTISELFALGQPHPLFQEWASSHRTIIILNAGNHGGVMRAYDRLQDFGERLNLPKVLFREDEESMNSMATATAVVVPQRLFDVVSVAPKFSDQPSLWAPRPTDGSTASWSDAYPETSAEHVFITFLKSYALANLG